MQYAHTYAKEQCWQAFSVFRKPGTTSLKPQSQLRFISLGKTNYCLEQSASDWVGWLDGSSKFIECSNYPRGSRHRRGESKFCDMFPWSRKNQWCWCPPCGGTWRKIFIYNVLGEIRHHAQNKQFPFLMRTQKMKHCSHNILVGSIVNTDKSDTNSEVSYWHSSVLSKCHLANHNWVLIFVMMGSWCCTF